MPMVTVYTILHILASFAIYITSYIVTYTADMNLDIAWSRFGIMAPIIQCKQKANMSNVE